MAARRGNSDGVPARVDPGLLIAIAAALFAIRAIEGYTYIAHHGLVRLPQQPCEMHHSWNSRRLISSGFMFSIASHSHHHTDPSPPYWRLRIDDTAPMVPFGPVVQNVLTALPPLWRRVMAPHVARWDASLASDAERALMAAQSGEMR